MTQPQDPRKHPLQDDEIALARVLRALPAGEPPAHLDDAILKAATDAVAAEDGPAAPRPRRLVKGVRWLPTWAIGTAAAAVLAVGVGMQLRPPLTPQPLPQASFADKKTELPESRERLSVDLVEPEREIVPMPGPPPSDVAPRSAAPAAPPPPPPPPPAPVVAPAPLPTPFVEPEPAPPATPAIAEDAGAFAPPPPASAASDAYSEVATDDAATLDTVEITGSRLRREAEPPARGGVGALAAAQAADAQRQRAQAQSAREQGNEARQLRQSREEASEQDRAMATAAEAPTESLRDAAAKARAASLPPVAEDARLAPAAWLDRVRERRSLGDAAGARESLRLFINAHPDAPVPSDLARLR